MLYFKLKILFKSYLLKLLIDKISKIILLLVRYTIYIIIKYEYIIPIIYTNIRLSVQF